MQASAVSVFHLVAAGQREVAAETLRAPISDLDGRSVASVEITSDEYSLNSVSGIVTFGDGDKCFFKFHTEEGEASNVGEYYRAHALADAGLPVDVPLAAATQPGHQLILYRARSDRRLVDVCRSLEIESGTDAGLGPGLLAAVHALHDAQGTVAVDSLHWSDGSRAAPSIHQLFWHRMVDADGSYPGGRLRRWYTGHADWKGLSELRWTINGTSYADSLADVIDRAWHQLSPLRLGHGPVVTAHGDDHAGNLWVEEGARGLTLFDPAFSGDDIPALLAFAKATFHNVFAHPHWLYHPRDIDLDEASIQSSVGTRMVTCASLSTLRIDMLDSIVDRCWIPLLVALADRDWLPDDWRATVRSALAMCPLLVTDLCSEARSPEARMIGLAHVVMMGSEPASGTDALSRALNRMEGAVR